MIPCLQEYFEHQHRTSIAAGWLRALGIVPGVIVSCIALGSLANAQDRRAGDPVQLVPEQHRDNNAAASEPKVTPEPKEFILPGQVIPKSVSARVGDPLYKIPTSSRTRRNKLDGDGIASGVFRPNVSGKRTRRALRDKKTGYFLRMPDGRLFALPVTAAKLKSISIRREIRRLALANRKRMRLTSGGRLHYSDRLRRRYSGRTRRLSEYFSDLSLKRDDIIVTQSGLRVFLGTDTFPYKAAHFVPLSQWRKGRPARRGSGRLEALQKQLRKPQR